MKYQEALNRIAKYCGVNNGSMLEDDLKTLQEAIEKAEQKHFAILSKHGVTYHCPNCKTRLDFSNVRILWTETEDKNE